MSFVNCLEEIKETFLRGYEIPKNKLEKLNYLIKNELIKQENEDLMSLMKIIKIFLDKYEKIQIEMITQEEFKQFELALSVPIFLTKSNINDYRGKPIKCNKNIAFIYYDKNQKQAQKKKQEQMNRKQIINLLKRNPQIAKTFLSPFFTTNNVNRIMKRKIKNQNMHRLSEQSKKTLEHKVSRRNINRFAEKKQLMYFKGVLPLSYVEHCIMKDNIIFSLTNCLKVSYLVSLVTYDVYDISEKWIIEDPSLNNEPKSYHIKLILSNLNILTKPSDILNILRIIRRKLGEEDKIRLECLKHNYSYYTKFGFKFWKYNKHNNRPVLEWSPPTLTRPTLQRNLTIRNERYNLNESIQTYQEVTLYRYGTGEHIIIRIVNGGFDFWKENKIPSHYEGGGGYGLVAKTISGGFKKEYINIKGYGKRLLRYTKKNRKYVKIHKKRKYLTDK